MTQRSLKPMLLFCAAAGFACGSERSFGPEFTPVFTSLELTTGLPEFMGPGGTVQLTVWAQDQRGELMPGTDAATYSSSAPAIAQVSSSGLVTAAAPGSAEITVSLTLGGITRTASTAVTVRTRPDVRGGVYDLSALITASDGWGYEGYRYTAVLTLKEEPGPSWIGGTFADLRLIGPEGDSKDLFDTGIITGSIDAAGRLVIELIGEGRSAGWILFVGTVTQDGIEGTFGDGGNLGGTFTAERR